MYPKRMESWRTSDGVLHESEQIAVAHEIGLAAQKVLTNGLTMREDAELLKWIDLLHHDEDKRKALAFLAQQYPVRPTATEVRF